MAMTAEELTTTLNALIDSGDIDANNEVRILLPQHRNDLSYSIEVIVDDAALPHLEIDTSSSEYFSEYRAD